MGEYLCAQKILDEYILASEFRLNWIFTPRLSLQLYLQPFLAVGHYDRFKELAKPRTSDYNTYGQGFSTIVGQNGRPHSSSGLTRPSLTASWMIFCWRWAGTSSMLEYSIM